MDLNKIFQMLKCNFKDAICKLIDLEVEVDCDIDERGCTIIVDHNLKVDYTRKGDYVAAYSNEYINDEIQVVEFKENIC